MRRVAHGGKYTARKCELSRDTDRETLSGNEAATLQRPTTQLSPMY